MVKSQWFGERLELLTAPQPSKPTYSSTCPSEATYHSQFESFWRSWKATTRQNYCPISRRVWTLRDCQSSWAIFPSNDAAFVLEKMQDEPEKLGGPLRKSLVDPIKKLPQISRSRCLAYILDRGMTRTDWEDTCKLVNEPGNYRLPNYNSLSLQKQTTRPKGRQFSSFYQIKSKLQPLGQVIWFCNAKAIVGR